MQELRARTLIVESNQAPLLLGVFLLLKLVQELIQEPNGALVQCELDFPTKDLRTSLCQALEGEISCRDSIDSCE